MDHVNNIPTGLLVPAQVPLDAKRVVLNEVILQNLGVDDHLAFTYEDGLIVFSVNSRQKWEWRERRTPIEGDTSLLVTDFVYPDGHVIAGIDYSLKSFNFFLKREAFLLSNIGTGSPVYKGFNVVNEKHEFYTLKTDNKLRLSYPSTDDGVLLFTFPNFDSFSDGVTPIGTPIYSGYNSGDNEFQFYTLDSTDITIKLDLVTGIISLSLPQTSSVPVIYISQDYVPTYDDWFKANRLAPGNGGIAVPGFQYKGEGTLAKPFTNTVSYTLNSSTPLPVSTVADTAITNGMSYYQGSGTRLIPDKFGQKIKILSSVNVYVYAGDFSYTGLDLEIYGYVVTTTAGALVDMDNTTYFRPWSIITPPNVFTNVKIYTDTAAILEIRGTGFWNSGYDISIANYSYGKIFYLLGKGQIISTQDSTTKYIINSGITHPTYNNAGFLTFEVTCQITCPGSRVTPPYGGQGIVQNGGLSKLEFREGAILNSGKLTDYTNTALEVIKITGGWIRVFDSIISLQGLNTSLIDREVGISLDKAGDLDSIGGPQIYMVNTSLRGHSKSWFNRKQTAGVVIATNCSSIYFGGGDLITSSGTPSTIWGGADATNRGEVRLKNNTFDSINLDTDVVDLTRNQQYAVSNTIGANVIQSLRVFYNRNDAIAGGLVKGGLYIKRCVIKDYTTWNLARLVKGSVLKIGVQGTGAPASPSNLLGIENFSSLGAPNNLLNTIFEYIPVPEGVTPPAFVFQGTKAELWYDEICIMI